MTLTWTALARLAGASAVVVLASGTVATATSAAHAEVAKPVVAKPVVAKPVVRTADDPPVPKELNNTVTSPEGGCPPGSADPDCTTTVGVKSMEVEKKADKTSAKPGDTVTYTLTIKNTGTVVIDGESVTDDLSGVLDDATYEGASTSGGEVTFTAPTLTWSGEIAPAATVTVTYTVKVNGPPATGGDNKLGNVVSGPPSSNCPPGSTDPRCTTSTPIAAIKVRKTVEPTTAIKGDKVTYKITVTNTGEATYTGATFTDNLADVLDDATFNGDQDANTGNVSYTEPTVTWSGDLVKGQVATITYSVTVK
ncbi:DUF7507 domain-containing protein [Nonomuraea soli]|uniref:Putative repeat protein (TIGR01451 family) n=1 Tax=Nonomuraea soli TaxID=1032476 RepID=A0A7W0CIV4_9ACTN|nr:DUF11 domain-containing protein [Nonomuraea soli]MBA2892032.1 putative repeat protein (TIGR01451 family) [Nonomuraea soli]